MVTQNDDFFSNAFKLLVNIELEYGLAHYFQKMKDEVKLIFDRAVTAEQRGKSLLKRAYFY